MNRLEEISTKLQRVRQVLAETETAAVRLRGTDWFAWATAGGSNTVLLAAETGVAEVLVTATDAWILTDEIEAQRLQDEQLPQAENSPYHWFVQPWADDSQRSNFIRDVTNGGKILSDRPSHPLESPLPTSLIEPRRVLLSSEIDRYRQVGRLATEAMTEVLTQAQPTWTEYQLAGAGAEALWASGLEPILTLAAGDRRLPLYRHPLPSREPLGRQAMLVFCARKYGLVVSLTRFVFFQLMSEQDKKLHDTIADIESTVLNQSRLETPLNLIYQALAAAYEQHGYPHAIREHHQGGTAGYAAREMIATPETHDRLAAQMILAWNPSIPGAKIEDTFVLRSDDSLENLSLDPNFPSVEIDGRLRAVPLER